MKKTPTDKQRDKILKLLDQLHDATKEAFPSLIIEFVVRKIKDEPVEKE